MTGEFEDLVAAGIIDPTKVVRTALQNAASIAGLLLTTDAPSPMRRNRRKPRPPMPRWRRLRLLSQRRSCTQMFTEFRALRWPAGRRFAGESRREIVIALKRNGAYAEQHLTCGLNVGFERRCLNKAVTVAINRTDELAEVVR